mmetsp:Transcript_1816/g.6448  ORF Transcript_1816/g.6448 Transcript_1816/m.6448 type:complete len:116 (+) Transcript_1816:387-734(+)
MQCFHLMVIFYPIVATIPFIDSSPISNIINHSPLKHAKTQPQDASPQHKHKRRQLVHCHFSAYSQIDASNDQGQCQNVPQRPYDGNNERHERERQDAHGYWVGFEREDDDEGVDE